MNCEFVRKITRCPVLDEAGHLNGNVRKVILKLKSSGKDPIKELTDCRDYLDQSIAYMEKNPHLFYPWQLYGKKKFKRGTKASLEYMKQGVCEILAVLSIERFDQMMS